MRHLRVSLWLLSLCIGWAVATVPGWSAPTSVPAVIVDYGEPLVPLRVVAPWRGYKVHYDRGIEGGIRLEMPGVFSEGCAREHLIRKTPPGRGTKLSYGFALWPSYYPGIIYISAWTLLRHNTLADWDAKAGVLTILNPDNGTTLCLRTTETIPIVPYAFPARLTEHSFTPPPPTPWNTKTLDEFLTQHPRWLSEHDTELLTAAAERNDLGAVTFLLARGARPNASIPDYQFPLVVAVKHNHTEVAITLLKHGADATKSTELISEALGHMNYTLANALLDHHAPVNGSGERKMTPLHMVCMTEDVAFATRLLDAGAEVNRKGGDGVTPLHCAALILNQPLVTFFLAHGADITAEDEEGTTPLLAALKGLEWARFFAAFERFGEPQKPLIVDELKRAAAVNTTRTLATEGPKVIDFLLAQGATAKFNKEQAAAAIKGAVQLGDVAIAQKIFDACPAASDPQAGVNRALFDAAETHNPAMLHFLFALGATLKGLADEGGETPLHRALSLHEESKFSTVTGVGVAHDFWEETPEQRQQLLETVRLLLDHGADARARYSFLSPRSGETVEQPIHIAAALGLPEIITLLLDRGAHVNDGDREDTQPLAIAAGEGHGAAVKLLLERGAAVNHVDKNGYSALHWAFSKYDSNTVTALLEHGANIHQRTSIGQTPLHMAGENEDEANSPPLSIDFIYQTPQRSSDKEDLQHEHLRAETARLLIARGAKVSAVDNAGNTPLHAAAHSGRLEISKLLLANGANPNARNHDGQTPLHRAADGRNQLTIDLLLVHGAQLNARDSQGMSPLDVALRSDADEVVVPLLKHGARAWKTPIPNWAKRQLRKNSIR